MIPPGADQPAGGRGAGRLLPALVAVGAGLLLALVLLMPYVAAASCARGGAAP